jgi:DNA-binding NarL/FixJ family response regulator
MLTMAEMTCVLIADDDDSFREALAMFLDELPGVVLVGEAKDGREAVALAAATGPDVVLLDLDMPVMDGLEAARILKERPGAPRIVICTGATMPDLDREAKRAGADAVIRKTARMVEFERALRASVAGPPAPASLPARRPRADEQAQQDRQHD